MAILGGARLQINRAIHNLLNKMDIISMAGDGQHLLAPRQNVENHFVNNLLDEARKIIQAAQDKKVRWSFPGCSTADAISADAAK